MAPQAQEDVKPITETGGDEVLLWDDCCCVVSSFSVQSIADGNTFHVVVLTRNEGYRMEAFRNKFVLKLLLSRYPKVIEAMLNRHEIYNRQLELCEQLEREGRARIIRPLEPLQVDRTDTNTEKLLALYDEGHREGAATAELLRQIALQSTLKTSCTG